MRAPRILALGVLGLTLNVPSAEAQNAGAPVFWPTGQTVGAWSLGAGRRGALANGTSFIDLTGNGRNAVVEGNFAGDLILGPGDPNFGGPGDGPTQIMRRQISTDARIVVNDDNDVFEMGPNQSFSIELYVEREDIPPLANWGILAGTWHSRNTVDDSADVNTTGAWYGYGLIRHENDGNGAFATGGWRWVMSPVTNGQPIIGHSNGPEKYLGPGFEIPAGRHYVVLSVDRAQQLAIAYLNGREVSRLRLQPEWSFTTPTDHPAREHARFMLFSGEDDRSRGAYRAAPAGAHIDAARVQHRALTPAQIQRTWSNVQAGLPDGAPPEAHRYELDGNLADGVRGGRQGRAEGQLAYVPGFEGGQGVRLDGTNAIRFDGADFSEQFTIAMWIKPDQMAPADGIETLAANSGGGFGTAGFRFFLNSYQTNDGRLLFETGNGGSGDVGATGAGVVVPGQWTHVAAVVNRPAGEIALYVNGQNRTADSTIRNDFTLNRAWSLGVMNDIFPYSGDMDSVKIFNRLLTRAEIEALVPAPEPQSFAVDLRASRTQAVSGQCVQFTASAAMLQRGETVDSWMWRVGTADWQSAPSATELAVDGVGAVNVTVQAITNQARTSSTTMTIQTAAPEAVARIQALLGAVAVDRPIMLTVGSTLTLDGSGSSSLVPSGALTCPLDSAQTVEAPDIVEHRWDLDGDGATDTTGAMVTTRFTDLGVAQVRLTVVNELGMEGTATIDVEVFEDTPPDAGAGSMPPTMGSADGGMLSGPPGMTASGGCRCVDEGPEPTALWLGLLFAGGILIRRRRA